jgi:hypothetical protein
VGSGILLGIIGDEGGDKIDFVDLHYDGATHVPEATAVHPSTLIPGFVGLTTGDYEMPVQTVWDHQGEGDGNNSRTLGFIHMGSQRSGRVTPVDYPFTSIGPGIVYGLGRKAVSSLASKTAMTDMQLVTRQLRTRKLQLEEREDL